MCSCSLCWRIVILLFDLLLIFTVRFDKEALRIFFESGSSVEEDMARQALLHFHFLIVTGLPWKYEPEGVFPCAHDVT